MEHISPLQCMIQYIQVGNDILGVLQKFAKETDMYLRISELFLQGQIAIFAAEAAVPNCRNSVHLAVQLLQQANQQYQASLAHLESVSSNMDHLKAGLDNLKQLMNSLETRVADLINQRDQIADRIRFVHIEVQSAEDVDLVLSVHDEMDWSGALYLADGLDSAQKDELTKYICSTELEELFWPQS